MQVFCYCCKLHKQNILSKMCSCKINDYIYTLKVEYLRTLSSVSGHGGSRAISHDSIVQQRHFDMLTYMYCVTDLQALDNLPGVLFVLACRRARQMQPAGPPSQRHSSISERYFNKT